MRNRSTVVGFATIILLMSAAGAQGLSGTNTVDSGDIIDGTIKNVDLKAGSISGSRLLNSSVTSAKIADGKVKTPDLADAAVNSAKIADNTVNLNTDTNMTKGSTNVDFPSINAGTCSAPVALSSGSFTFRDDDAVAATADPDDWPTGLTFYTTNDSTGGLPGSSKVSVVACNVTGGSIDAPSTEFDWAQLP